METLTLFYKIKLFAIFVAFFAHGYSTPLDMIKNQNCLNGFWIQINGNYRCIDTTIRYYPTDMVDRLIPEHSRLIALNLQLLEESKWDTEDG